MKMIFGIALFFSLSCQARQEQNKPMAEVLAKPDSAQQSRLDSIEKAVLKEKERAQSDSIAAIAKSKPIWGERMIVVGDFDGDGKQDTLYERYISKLTGKETNKDYDFEGLGDDIDWIGYTQIWIANKVPLVRLESKNPAIKRFDVESGGAQNGFGYLKNVGDLNGDSTDEIVYYIYDVDFSMMNSCALATYKNGNWKEVHHWDITENDFFNAEGEAEPNPIYIRKKNGQVYCKEMDWGAGEYVWKRLKTNW